MHKRKAVVPLWTLYVRGDHKLILKSDEFVPAGYKAAVRTPTVVEIEAEQARRDEKEKRNQAFIAFQARADVKAMESVRNLIENYPETVIQALNPEQWIILRNVMQILVGDDPHKVVAESLGLVEPKYPF